MGERYDYLFKFIIIGDAATGKSCLLHRFDRDKCSRDSYNHVTTWLNDARSLASSDITIVLVGNKIDLADDREVTFLEASRFSQENGSIDPDQMGSGVQHGETRVNPGQASTQQKSGEGCAC